MQEPESFHLPSISYLAFFHYVRYIDYRHQDRAIHPTVFVFEAKTIVVEHLLDSFETESSGKDVLGDPAEVVVVIVLLDGFRVRHIAPNVNNRYLIFEQKSLPPGIDEVVSAVPGATLPSLRQSRHAALEQGRYGCRLEGG